VYSRLAADLLWLPFCGIGRDFGQEAGRDLAHEFVLIVQRFDNEGQGLFRGLGWDVILDSEQGYSPHMRIRVFQALISEIPSENAPHELNGRGTELI